MRYFSFLNGGRLIDHCSFHSLSVTIFLIEGIVDRLNQNQNHKIANISDELSSCAVGVKIE